MIVGSNPTLTANILNMATVKQLRELLETMPDDYEVVIYPKYSAHEVDGYRKHTFRIDQVCEQTPSIKNTKDSYENYEVNNHIAILF